MNTNQYRNHLLDEDWIVAIEEEIAANPMGVAFSVEPEIIARYDSEHGFPCDPLGRGYTKLGDIEMYICSYKDTAATWAAAIQEVNDTLHAQSAPLFDYAAELEDQIEGRLDNEFWATGGW